AAAGPAAAATAAPHAVSAAPLKQPVQQGVQQPGEPTPAAPALHSSPPPAPVHARPSDISTAPPPPGEPLAERATEAAPVPPAFTAEWVNSSRMPALSSPSVPQLPTDEAAPPLGLSPPTDKNAPTFDPPSVETARALSQPGLAPASVEAFRSEVPPRSSSLGWIVTLVFLLLVGAGLGALYWKKPQLFFAGRDRIVELAQRAGRAVGLSSAPSRVAGPPFDTPSAGAVLERAAQQASGCAEPGGPTGRGRVKVLYQQDGRALNAVVSPPFHETQVGRCLVGLFKNTQVPAFGGEPVIVSKTFTVR
ncbi:MAG TPA: hypothetical protein VLC09_11055, partial [Polyangiaceae bacterium]|nr:hypothetical protein [Polyangiaceae bacterium]